MAETIYITGVIISLLGLIFLVPVIQSQLLQLHRPTKLDNVKKLLLIITLSLLIFNLFCLAFDWDRLLSPRTMDTWALFYNVGNYTMRLITSGGLFMIYRIKI